MAQSVRHKSDVANAVFAQPEEEAPGVELGEYVIRRRVERALYMLKNRNCDLKEGPYRVGFSDSLEFEKHFCRLTDMTPWLYRQRILGQPGLWDDTSAGRDG